MEAIQVQARRTEKVLDFAADLHRARILAKLLDAEFCVAGIRFGPDPIIGLVPVVGDTVTFLAGIYPIHLARKHGLGQSRASHVGQPGNRLFRRARAGYRRCI